MQNNENEEDIEVYKYVRACNRYNIYIYYTYMCMYVFVCIRTVENKKLRRNAKNI